MQQYERQYENLFKSIDSGFKRAAITDPDVKNVEHLEVHFNIKKPDGTIEPVNVTTLSYKTWKASRKSKKMDFLYKNFSVISSDVIPQISYNDSLDGIISY